MCVASLCVLYDRAVVCLHVCVYVCLRVGVVVCLCAWVVVYVCDLVRVLVRACACFCWLCV